MEQNRQQAIELRSEEMQDILTRPPHVLVRSGISVICGVISLLTAGSFFFKYPDIVQGEILITTQNPPVWLVAKTSGKIKELNCSDKQTVKIGEILAVIENPAETNDVLNVKNLLSQSTINDSVFCLPKEISHTNCELGVIQNVYSAFVRAAVEYQNFLSLSATQKEKEALNFQISGHKNYTDNLRKQLQLKKEELEIAKSAYEREKHLFEKGTISKAEMETAESVWLTIRQSLQQLQTSLASNRIEFGQLRESLSKLDIQYQRERNSLLSNLKTATNELETAIENWEQTCLLISPINGTVTFNTFWTNNQFTNAGDKVLAVISENQGKILGRIKSPDSMSGKIKPEQRVNVKVNGYPYMEYGTLQGLVKTISLVPNENNYIIEINLNQGLITNTGKTLAFTGELTGQAEIITDDRPLFDRVFAPLKYLLKKYVR
ncbi:MAG: HlyD family efflux transporter periplasmic adaptor subunit [Candidatus Symbiothrix sp.]|jgi:HlyD family secretion protein|nr:HlyD family efflux transporter periplasmic adaptor subunit [Candidatus Symbiothrix sp.]